MENQPKTRAQADSRWTWNLGDIYATQEAFEADCARLTADIDALSGFEGTLAQGGKPRVLEAVRAYWASIRRMENAGTYAFLLRAQDNGEAAAQAMADRVQVLEVELGTCSAFLRPELLALPEALLRDCMADPDFAEYDVFLADVLRYKPHTLSAAEERIVSAYGEVVQGPQNTTQMLTYVDMRFPDIAGEDGEPAAVTEGKFIGFLQSPNRRVRADAYACVLGAYGALGNTFAATYATNVKADLVGARLHRFDTAREAALFGDEVPVSVYDSLIEAVHGALPTLARYIALRRRVMGLDAVHLYDLYVPMTGEFDLALPYPKAYELVVEGVSSALGEEYGRVLREAYERRWIDVYENRGKNTGAFCSGCYDAHPYVLLNYEDGLSETLTIAHEMGHAMHSYYSEHAQPFAKAHYEIFVAEVASTVNEVLVLRYLMKRHTRRADQAALVNHLLENFRTTIFRQVLFAEFEHLAHKLAEEGEALTRERLCEVYYELNRRYYGEEAVVDEQVADEWMRIPHFYSSFYVYKYATGFSAAVAIAQRLLTEGEPAVCDYLRFLRTGGSMPPIEELKIAGVDLSTPQPVEQALAYFAELVGQMEALID